MKSLTTFEETLLIAVYLIGENAYSVIIHQKILQMTGNDIVLGSLYNGLDQLSKKRYLKKKKSEPVSEKGGKSKMYYSVSTEGINALEETRRLRNSLWNEMPDVFYKES
ncbi:hypothetical protein ACFL4T_08795 [candidate division KSB1 bacterium]